MNFTISNEFHNFQWISQFQLNFIISTEFHHFKWISTFQRNFTISTEFYHFNLIWPFLCTQLVLPKIKKSWTIKSQNLEKKQFTLFNHQYHIFANNFNQSHWSCNLHLARFLKSFPSHQHWKAQHRSNFIWISSPNQHLSALPQILLAIDLARQIVFFVPEIRSPNTFWFFEY